MAVSLDILSDTDLKRFALCWLNCDRSSVNWAAAAAAYDPEVKVESFKTVTGKATSKALKAAGGEVATTTPKPKKAAGGKRKKAASEEAGDDEEAPKPKKGKGGRPKKAKSEEKVASEAEDEGEKVKDKGEASD